METKFCPGCRTTKAVSEFYRDSDRANGLSSWCKACKKASRQTGRAKALKSRTNRRHRYGISDAQFEAMLKANGYRCALCGGPFADVPSQRPQVDHLHGHCSDDPMRGCRVCVRGVLHQRCNVLVGHFEGRGYTRSGLDNFIREYVVFHDERITAARAA